MRENSDNRKRAFADVVNIDAWHDSFSSSVSAVDLHADVVFGTARVGGDSQSPVRFRLSIKRAEVIVIIPDSEPLAIDRKSVSRDTPELEGQFSELIEHTSRSSAGGGISGSISLKEVKASASTALEGKANQSTFKKIELTGKIQLLLATQSKTSDGHYRWSIESQTNGILDGRPWDAVKQPRLKLIDQRKDRARGIPPTVRVEVRCKREDLVIRDLQIKDETLWESAKRRAGFKNKLAAAESYIREHLSKEGLEVRNIEDIFGSVTLASTTAESV
ncbi:hypothetical protein [Tardiphaga sp. OK245]|uniref:hypothetical protein n=1 Tax=Tardiphaga sp. OK245 TaxID=1855306 RepID=UPI0008A7C060|nr:hypothetical protein [Tardiphaga sp. OK245]SEI15764.1 hypothetical protein SAMN05216367_4242 [Tardiphaga sp. OK245]